MNINFAIRLLVILCCYTSHLNAQSRMGSRLAALQQWQIPRATWHFQDAFLPVASEKRLYLAPVPKVPSCYDYHQLAFFCKLEVRIEKKVSIPFRFRLGSVDYVDYLEGKHFNWTDR